MCGYCSQTDITVTKLETDEETECEWISEEFGPDCCDRPAVYSVSEWYVEDHLCEAHKAQTEKEMEEGLGDFMASVGFGSQFEFRPIEQEESCEYTAPSAMDWTPCGKKATQAKYVLENSALCAEHAAESGRASDAKEPKE